MILYYDRNNNLKEVINDASIVESADVNNIYVYFEKIDEITLTGATLVLEQDDTRTISLYDKVTYEIPFNSDRDLSYFEYFTDYTMLKFSIPSDLDNGLVVGNLMLTTASATYSLMQFTFLVQANNVLAGERVSKSDYEQLLRMLTGVEYKANKTSSINSTNLTSEILYPNVKAIVDYVVGSGEAQQNMLLKDITLNNYVLTFEFASGLKRTVSLLGLFTPYATQSWVEAKGYLTDSSLNNYYTKAEIEDKGYLTSSSLDSYYTKVEINELNNLKQDKLISGTSIKTINGTSLLGGGDIVIESGTDKNSVHTITMSMDQETYVITLVGKNSSGEQVTTTSVDLPIESVVVSGSYDSENKTIILTLQNGNKITIPVGDLVSGLQTQLTDDQLSACNSGITAEKVTQYNNYSTEKQNTLVSGTNIKTINGSSILGSGNIVVSGGGVGYDEVYPITYSLTNVTISGKPAGIVAGDTIAMTAVGSSIYGLPDEISVTNATYTWNQLTGVLTLSNATGDVTITINGLIKLDTPINLAVSDTEVSFDAVEHATSYEVVVDDEVLGEYTPATYEINVTVSNLTAGENPTTIVEGQEATLTFTADGDNYQAPTSMPTITGATGVYTRTSDTDCSITLSEPTGNVSFEMAGEVYVYKYSKTGDVLTLTKAPYEQTDNILKID